MNDWPTGRSRDGGIDEIPLAPSPGGLWLCGKHAIGPHPDHALAATGATVVVCLCEEHELSARYPDYVAWLRNQPSERVVWCPVPDLHAPPVAEASDLVNRMRALLDRGEVILMHCGAGIGRAGTMAAAVLMSMGKTRDEAVAEVAARRPTAGPEAGAQSALLDALAAEGPQGTTARLRAAQPG